jgi:hypothetical protein
LSDLRTTAEALAIAVEEVLIPVADVVAWADARIAESDVPHIALCDLAMARNAYPVDIANYLRSLPGEVDYTAAAREVVKIALAQLRSGVDPSTIGDVLSVLDEHELLPDGDFRDEAWTFGDGIDLARRGHIEESEASIFARMTAAIEKFLNS